MFAHTVFDLSEFAAWLRWGIAIIVLVGAVRAIALVAQEVVRARHRRAERLGAVLPVVSTSQAFEVAHSILAAQPSDVPRFVGVPASVDHDGLWRSLAEPALAALLYAASQQREPLAWLEQMASQLRGNDDAGWRAAIEAVTVTAVDSTLCEWFTRTSAMDRRQRGSVAIVMSDAVTRYAAAQR